MERVKYVLFVDESVVVRHMKEYVQNFPMGQVSRVL